MAKGGMIDKELFLIVFGMCCARRDVMKLLGKAIDENDVHVDCRSLLRAMATSNADCASSWLADRGAVRADGGTVGEAVVSALFTRIWEARQGAMAWKVREFFDLDTDQYFASLDGLCRGLKEFKGQLDECSRILQGHLRPEKSVGEVDAAAVHGVPPEAAVAATTDTRNVPKVGGA